MKKISAFLLAVLTVLSLASCGSGYSKKEVAEYINVTDYKNGLVTKEEYQEAYDEQMEAVKDSYCTPEEVEGETKITDGLIVNATYDTLLEIIKVEEPVEITVGENTIVNGDRTGDDESSTKTFDNSLIGLTITEDGKDITYTYSSDYGKDADGKDTAEKYLRNTQVTVSVKIVEIDGKTDAETKIADGSKVKLTYTITLKLTDFSGSKKDITVGETLLGDVISIDDVLKELTTPKKEEATEEEEDEHTEDDGHDHSEEEEEETETDYKLAFEKNGVVLEENEDLDEYLVGKTVNISGTVHTVKETPEFTDALVKEKSEGTYETIKDLEKAIVDSVCTDLGMTKLIEKSLIIKTLPKDDIEEAYENIETNMKSYYYMFMGTQCLSNEALASFVATYGSYFGLSVSDSSVETMTQTFAANAAAVVKQNMLFYYVAEAEGLEVTDDEYDAYVKEQAEASDMSKKEFVKNSGGKDAVKETMLFTEVTEYLRDLVKEQLSL